MIIAGRNDAAGRAADAAAVLPEVKTSSGRSKSLLSMYAEPPSGEIKMEDFETFAIDRLCVLKTIEEQKAKGTKPDGMAAKVKEVESKYIGSTATLSRKVLAALVRDARSGPVQAPLRGGVAAGEEPVPA
jgi:hypothetical protein